MEMEGDQESKESNGPEVLWGKAFAWEIRGASVEAVWGITGNFVGVDKWMTTLVQSCELADGELQKPGCVRHAVLYPSSSSHPFTVSNERLLLMDEHSHHYIYTILGGSTLPGFSLMKNYVSSFKLSSLTHHNSSTGFLTLNDHGIPHEVHNKNHGVWFAGNNATPTTNTTSTACKTTPTTNTTSTITNIDNPACVLPSEQESTLLQWSFTCYPDSSLTEQDAHNIAFSLYKAAIDDLKKHLTLEDNVVKLLS